MDSLDLPIVEFEPRFVRKDDLADLANLWQLSATAIGSDRHKRMLWTAKHFAEDHGVDQTAVYKDLSAMLDFGRT